MSTAEVAPLMALGRRIAYRLAAAWGVLHFADELASVALAALPEAIGEHDPAEGPLKDFAAQCMAREIRRTIKKERTRLGRELPAQDLEIAPAGHPAIATDELAADAMDALLAVYTGEDLRSGGDAKLLTQEAWACLHREIALLDATDRRLVELRYFEEMPWKEVAGELGLEVRNAQKHDARIRQRLHDRLIAWYRVRPLRRTP